MTIYADIAVIGSGPAGVAAAIQAGHEGMSVMLFGDEPIGGLAAAGRRIDNLPGFSGGISGVNYCGLLRRQVDDLGISVRSGRVTRIDRMDHCVELRTDDGGCYFSRCVILATGTEPVAFDLPGLESVREERRFHRNVRTLPADLRGLHVVVIGGGEAAMDTALSAIDRGARVDLLVRSSHLKGNPALVEEVSASGIAVSLGTTVIEIKNCSEHDELIVGKNGQDFRIAFHHLLACTGRQPNSRLWNVLGGKGTPADIKTDIDGVFAAGDLLRSRHRYIVTAQEDGARAALLAAEFVIRVRDIDCPIENEKKKGHTR